MRDVRVTNLAVEKQYALHILSVLIAVATQMTKWRMRMRPYCRLWPGWLYQIYPHYFINGTIFVIKKS